VETAEDLRFRLKLHYDGTHFFGWQIQKSERTVQGELEAALKQLTGARRPVLGSGRTDRGVHATGQVAAVTVPPRWQSDTLKRALNAVLPADIWVQEIKPVPLDFNPRYAATARTYEYRIGTGPEAHSPFRHSWSWALDAELDLDLMHSAAAKLVGRHSFKSFAKSGQPERGEFCTIQSAAWRHWEDLGLIFRITADRYLHRMVRYLVGTMVDIGRGRRPSEDLTLLLDDPEGPLETSPPAPPQGLFLSYVAYDGPEDVPPHLEHPDPQKAEAETAP
jgi:tRNA pseudouridine38-40 synthase